MINDQLQQQALEMSFAESMQLQKKFENMGRENMTGVEFIGVVAAVITIIMFVDYVMEESDRDRAFREEHSLDADGDLDGDGIKNVNDSDIDGDGVPNEDDKYPEDSTANVVAMDTDGDGMPDSEDRFPDDPTRHFMQSAAMKHGLSNLFEGAAAAFDVTETKSGIRVDVAVQFAGETGTGRSATEFVI